MLAALIIVFREVFEAGLIVGIVLAVTRSVPQRGLWVSGGVAGGVLGACIVAAFAGVLSDAFAGSGQELFNALILAIAVVMLTWHNVWMARHGKELAGELVAAGQAVVEGSKSLFALAVVVGVAVLREGSEVVLFLYGVLAAGSDTTLGIALGGFLGLALGALTCVLTYLGLVSIPTRTLFTTTTVLIALLAAGMAAQAVQFLDAAGWVDVLGNRLWDSSAWLPQDGVVGRLLHTLVGYTDRPTELQLVAYLGTLAAMAALTWMVGRSAIPVRERTAVR